MSTINEKLQLILADTYALYLKTQNYHWHVTGPQFKSLHELFEEQYRALAEAIDEVAERIRILGFKATASFIEFQQLKTIKDGNANNNANQMVSELYEDNLFLIKVLTNLIEIAANENDEGTVALLSERISQHEKSAWMLGVSRA